MTIEEAKEIINTRRECVLRAEKCDRRCGECELVLPADDILTAYDLSISALEKQIPVEPSSYKGLVFECPKCEERVGKNIGRYCTWCGQKIRLE